MGDWFKLWGKLKKLKIDHIHEMHQGGRTEKFFKLYSSFCGVSYTFHNHHLDRKSGVVDHGKIKPLIQRDLDGVYTYLGKERPNYLSYVPKMPLGISGGKKKRVILGVVATRATKMWPFEYYGELAEKLKARGFEVLVPLSESDGDKAVGKKLIDLGMDRFGETYTFFGPELPLEWHPYDKEKHPYFYVEGLECRTRDAHFCGLNECESMVCLKDIGPEKVMGTYSL
jgi:heptosyltransferase-2